VLVHDRYARRSRSYRKAVHTLDRLSSHTLRFCPRRRARASRGKRSGPQSRREETTEIRDKGLEVRPAGILSSDGVGNASTEKSAEESGLL
jgi:hypothetical protein